MTRAAGLTSLSLGDLERFRRLLEAPSGPNAVTEAWLQASGFGHVASSLATLFHQMPVASVLLALDVAIAERRHRPPAELKLVWTGPDSPGSTTRDTALLVSDLLADAREAVLIAGYRFDRGAEMFAALHQVMHEQGVEAAVFIDLDVPGMHRTHEGAMTYARCAVDAFLRQNWPFGPPLPRIYYDPRTALPGPPWVSMHAKCLVVDERLTFITSANFTDRGQARNVELGVLIEDRGFAQRVSAQWWSLVHAGLVREADLG